MRASPGYRMVSEVARSMLPDAGVSTMLWPVPARFLRFTKQPAVSPLVGSVTATPDVLVKPMVEPLTAQSVAVSV